MLGSIWLEVSSYAEIFSICLAIPNNLVLIFCIFHKSPQKFGNYRYLMAFFCYQSIWFSIITLVLNVNYYTFNTSISIFVRRNLLQLPDTGMYILTSVACCSNCMMFVALSVQFLYRYYAMTKSPRLKMFDSWRMSLWYFFIISVSVCFGIIVFICGPMMEESREDRFRFIESLSSTFEISENTTFWYARMTYYTRSTDGSIIFDLCSVGCLCLLVLSTFPVIVMIYCGYHTYRKMCEATAQLSNHMKLQKELFQALLLQSSIPCIFLFIPSLAYFICPVFNIPLGLFSNLAGITFVIYPVIDPIVVLYVIKYYRVFLLKLFCMSHKIAPKMEEEVVAAEMVKNEEFGLENFHSIS